MAAVKKKNRRERLTMRIEKGCLVPADHYTQERLRERNFKRGDYVSVDIRKARLHWYNKKVHLFGDLVSKNIDEFHGMKAHNVLKRLQLEGGIACDEMSINFPGVGPCVYRIPQSLSYDNMEQSEFEAVYAEFCAYVIRKYWPGMTERKIEEMADLMETPAS